ncbi:MAG: hypothetical protein OXU66_15650 [Gammaproteobacteria bacterium]|jgi:hypothetical protein|nr:hypothetical protein [Gammaproteobacteria bacterium]MDD9894388.1 hypothetical protein [Gammaproteobacteria bacterium]MDD9960350.1 hypothetical protein [Gammaproteobacteria bacterium]
MSLDLVDQGSLTRPGLIGRFVRLSLGIACLYGLWELIAVAPFFIERPIELLPNLSFMILVVLCIFNYVVNIGFSKDWNRYPVFVSVLIFTVIAAASYLVSGTPSSMLLGGSMVLWMAYFYAHLGISFVLAAILATPGCEMRAIPELFGRLTNRDTKEHHCPSSIISGIDRWEASRKEKS